MTASNLTKLLIIGCQAARLNKGTSNPSGASFQEGCPVIWLKWWPSRQLKMSFYISNHVLVGNNAFVSECSNTILSLPCIGVDHDTNQVMKFVYCLSTYYLSTTYLLLI
jgi:hypothetical protein